MGKSRISCKDGLLVYNQQKAGWSLDCTIDPPLYRTNIGDNYY
jgi:hypothetical protein